MANAPALLRLLPMTDQAKDAEILALRHQIAVLEGHLHGEKVPFAPADRAFLAAASTEVVYDRPGDGRVVR
jgi:putative transposase